MSVVIERPVSKRPQRAASRLQGRWLVVFAASALTATVLALWGLGKAAERSEVLVLRAEVAAGQVLTREALGVTGAASDDGHVRFVPAGQLDEVVGLKAARPLLPGTLLAPGDVTGEPSVAEGERTVGALLAPGRFPAILAAGDEVLALAATLSELTPVRARLLDVEPRGDRTEVVLVVDAQSAPAVARWAAADDLALVGEGGR